MAPIDVLKTGYSNQEYSHLVKQPNWIRIHQTNKNDFDDNIHHKKKPYIHAYKAERNLCSQ